MKNESTPTPLWLSDEQGRILGFYLVTEEQRSALELTTFEQPLAGTRCYPPAVQCSVPKQNCCCIRIPGTNIEFVIPGTCS